MHRSTVVTVVFHKVSLGQCCDVLRPVPFESYGGLLGRSYNTTRRLPATLLLNRSLGVEAAQGYEGILYEVFIWGFSWVHEFS